MRAPASATVCLNMIVKDESRVVGSCLASVKPLVDYWVIVDTGSTDGTADVIGKALTDVPGELHERPWVNFEHNRNEALDLARGKGDYVLFIDADEVLRYSAGFRLPPLVNDCYCIVARHAGVADNRRIALVNNRLDWRWHGVIHEVIACPHAKSAEVLDGVVNIVNSHGAEASGRSGESVAAKYLRDAATLENALIDDPADSRYAYYLAMSYAAAGEPERAEESFHRRLAMPAANTLETFLTLYNLGLTQVKLGKSDEARQTFHRANIRCPNRAEPLLELAKIYRHDGSALLGYLLTRYALSLPYPAGDVYVYYAVYDHLLLVEFANCALLLGKFDEGLQACRKLLANPDLPAEFTASVRSNAELARRKLAEVTSRA